MKNTEKPKQKESESTKKEDAGASGSSTTLINPLMALEEMGQEDMEHLENMKKTLAEMLAATKKQPNISQVVKAGLTAMVELCDALVTQEKKRTSLRNKLKEEVEKLPKWSPSKKRGTGSRKRRKKDLTHLSDSEEELMRTEIDSSSQVVTDSDATSLPDRTRFQKDKQDLDKETQRKADREAKREADRSTRIRKQAEAELRKKEAEKKRKEEEEKLRIEQEKRRQQKEATNKDKRRNLKRPQALVIKVSETLPYAEVLRKLKQTVKPSETNTEIRAIKRTMGGDVMLEMEPSCGITGNFRKAVEDAVGEGLVKDLKPRASLEIRDIDSLTSVQEVKEAIEDKLGGNREDISVDLTTPNGRQQILAIVSLSGGDAEKLIEAGKIRIGWVNCRIRRRVDVPRCFKCMDYGHFARECKGPDRAATCLKCGETGHKRATCTNDVKCLLCAELGVADIHAAGKKGCTAFRRALERRTKGRS